MIDLTNETTVTADNIDDIRESIPSDMAAEIEPGCTVWQRGGYNEEGRTLLRFPSGRGAWCWGGNSVWGDWDSSGNLLFDDGGSVDADGNAEKHITLWLDETSEPGNPGWIVSEDTDDTTNTIAVFPQNEKAEAAKRAETEATRRGLRLVID